LGRLKKIFMLGIGIAPNRRIIVMSLHLTKDLNRQDFGIR
jgi:hypothetical protein